MFQRYGLATGTWGFITIYALFTVMGIVLILLFHETPMQIALDMLATSVSGYRP